MNNTLNAPHPYFVCTAEQSQLMDKRTIKEFGIDGYTLMEVAGSSAASHLLESIDELTHGLYLCGKGNNAGDALVVARYLIQHGHDASLLFISGTADLSPDTQKNLELLLNIKHKDENAGSLQIIKGWDEFEADQTQSFSYIIDGMLGTGLDSDLRGDYTSAVEWANHSGVPIFAIDIPTGLHGDSGQIMGNAIRASRTYTFGAHKQGFYLDEGFSCTGDIIYCELPFPNFLKNCNTFLLDNRWVREPSLKPADHKYDAGVLYVIAGSEGLTGAAMMTAQSAWAEGVGAVILVCPRGILSVFENNLPQIIKKPVGTKEDTFFKPEHLDDVMDAVHERSGEIILGPGLGRNRATVSFVEEFCKKFNGSLLIDADALWCLSELDEWHKSESADWVLTPHPGELARLVPNPVNNGIDRLRSVREFSSSHSLVVVSKGYPAIIARPSGDCFLTHYDTRIFGRAGFGDVLSGKIGAYLALGNTPAKSAALGLLNGYGKVRTILQNTRRRPEPKDLI